MESNPNLMALLDQESFLPVEKKNKIEALIKVFQEIDQKIITFKKHTGLRCLPGCSDCCQNPCVTASPLEMFPLALSLYRQKTLDQWINKVDRHNEQSLCLFYATPVLSGKGHCSIYPFRPLVCRLFGFTARENKHQDHELMICQKIKKEYDSAYRKALKMKNQKVGKVPVSRHYVMKIYGISPQLAGTATNINLAFLQAAETIGHYGSLFDLK